MLESLIIHATEDTPDVILNAQDRILTIKGRSLPENAFDFYSPVLRWVDQYCEINNQPTIVEIAMDYFNSSTGRYLFEILASIEASGEYNQMYTIRWIVDRGDEIMHDKGEELKELLDLKIEIICRS